MKPTELYFTRLFVLLGQEGINYFYHWRPDEAYRAYGYASRN